MIEIYPSHTFKLLFSTSLVFLYYSQKMSSTQSKQEAKFYYTNESYLKNKEVGIFNFFLFNF